MATKAYGDGERAAATGDMVNPYEEGTPEYVAWLVGFSEYRPEEITPRFEGYVYHGKKDDTFHGMGDVRHGVADAQHDDNREDIGRRLPTMGGVENRQQMLVKNGFLKWSNVIPKGTKKDSKTSKGRPSKLDSLLRRLEEVDHIREQPLV